ncbi:MAG: hypothetical protein GY707_13135 [Desulfobacteraceae bacterium]|nr:hypothetical protein [Desulfobacteraceae bacterium]
MAQSNPGQKPHPPAPTDAEKDASPNAGLEAPDDQLTEIEVKHRDAVNKINTENPRQAKLNEDLDFDLLKGGGPNWNAGATHGDNWRPFYVTSVTTPPTAWDVQKGSKMELWDSDATDDSPTQWKKIHHSSGDGDEGWKNVWVEKKFGDSYEYTEGNSVSIVRGNSQEIIFDGREIVEKYKGDGSAKKYYYKSGSGRKEEKKWNHKTGKLVSDSLITISGDDGEVVETTIDKYERSSAGRQIGHTWTKEVGGKGKETVNNKYDYRTGASYSYSAEATDGTDFEKFSIGYQHKNIADFSFGDQQSFSLKGSPVDLTCNVNVGYAYSFNFKLAGTFNLELAAVDAITIKTGFCIGMDLDYRIGGFIKRDPADDYAFKTVGITLQKESVGKLKAAADLYADHGKVKIGKNTFLLSVLDTAKVDL